MQRNECHLGETDGRVLDIELVYMSDASRTPLEHNHNATAQLHARVIAVKLFAHRQSLLSALAHALHDTCEELARRQMFDRAMTVC